MVQAERRSASLGGGGGMVGVLWLGWWVWCWLMDLKLVGLGVDGFEGAV